MTSERWDRIKRIAGDALEIDRSHREAFLVDACGADAELHAEILTLLGTEDPPGRFLEPDPPPERIGVYRIVREIGRGGMGAVYEGARDDAQFQQRVAIKIVKRGMDTGAVLRRFYAERQILARLQHPHIGRLFDGGMTADGRPYFVMEYLQAKPITTYCDERALATSARIDSVDRRVRHRRVRPRPPRAAPGPEAGQHRRRRLRHAEAARFRHRQAARRRRFPRARHRAGSARDDAGVRQPRATSRRTADHGERRLRPRREIVPSGDRRGDLVRIVRKALEEDVARRYRRAGDLADDLRRFRANQPVTARPSGVAYRASRYVVRHWRGLAVATTAAVIVIGAAANALVQGRRAERHFREVRQLANSFLFEFHDAIAKLPGATPARELVLTRAVQYLDSLSREAANDLDLKRELAESYERVAEAQGLFYEANLGKEAVAQANFEKAIALFRDLTRARPSDVGAQADLANAMIGLSSVLHASDPPRRRALFDEVVARLRGVHEPRAEMMLANAYTGLAEDTTAHPTESLQLRNQAIGIYAELSKQNPPHPDSERVYSISLKRRAALYLAAMHDAAAANVDLRAAEAIDERRVAADPDNSVARLDLALGDSYRSVALRQLGKLPDAFDALERCLAIRRELFRADPQNVRNQQLLEADNAKIPILIAAIKKSGGPDALLRRAEALATSR